MHNARGDEREATLSRQHGPEERGKLTPRGKRRARHTKTARFRMNGTWGSHKYRATEIVHLADRRQRHPLRPVQVSTV